MEQQPRKRNANGTFAEGQPPPAPHVRRKRGKHNRITTDIKNGVIGAAVEHGFDGKGKGGLQGYCLLLASKHPKVFAGLLGKMLPLKLEGSLLDGAAPLIVRIETVPSGCFFSPEQVEQMRPRLTLDHAEPEAHRPT